MIDHEQVRVWTLLSSTRRLLNHPLSSFQYVNPAHERLMGYSCEELTGRNVYELYDRTQTEQQEIITSHINKEKVK